MQRHLPDLRPARRAEPTEERQAPEAGGHFENTASGVCAKPCATLLEHARLTGDADSLAAGIRLLWGTANLFSHPRYVHGAATSCNVETFAYAAAQVKKAIEVTHRLGGAPWT